VEAERPGDYAQKLFTAIRSRRVCRRFTSEPVAEADLWLILEAGRRAASAGNVRIHRFLVVREPKRLRLVRMLSPGMLAVPQALIVICTDLEAAAAAQLQVEKDPTVLMDVGTAAMNMMLAAQALGLGSCPATSFSPTAIAEILQLPPHARAEFMLQLGHPAPEERSLPAGPKRRVSAADLTFWERYGDRLAPADRGRQT
jgi:nitroreductase